MKNTLEFYNKIYEPFALKNYGKKLDQSVVALKIFKKFSIKHNVKIKNVIDVGCRWGRALRYWRRNGVEVCGIEVSETMVQYCKKKELNCYLASATDLSIFKDKQFDLYMATDVYEHLRTKDLDDAIKEAKRVTKKYLLIRPYPRIDKRKLLHLTVWTSQKWEKFFKKHDLKIINIGNNKVTYRHVFLTKIKNGD